MRKAQELSLNLIVIGALALLVLVIIGGAMVFGGGDLMEGLTSMGPSEEEVDMTSFQQACQSKCNILQMTINDASELGGDNTKAFCCESADLDGSGAINTDGELGPEYCGKAYDCTVEGQSPAQFCDSDVVGTSYGDCPT